MNTVAQRGPRLLAGRSVATGPNILNRIDATFAKLRAAARTALIPYVTVGDPTLALRSPSCALVAAGAM
jgi:hypothetical protein